MDPVYLRIRKRARQIISTYPPADFYVDFKAEGKNSRRIFESDSIILELRKQVGRHLENDFGHGIRHANKVTVDAGTLMQVEARRRGLSEKVTERNTIIVQCAGLLHDVKRKRHDHAVKGADHAGRLLSSYSLTETEISHICYAIRSHEAFTPTTAPESRDGVLISDCLYDADKFRWGPDNFADTVWDMVSSFNTPLNTFIDHYPDGMQGLHRIKKTFRTETGKKYGLQFIDMGIAIGEELYRVINTEFAPGNHR
ncbi:MAG: hypothetical protein HKM93_13735 [Desulfobacteraceae bacterium]|nr:hypothetical protein [Desulfobacteraceae bacterium]